MQARVIQLWSVLACGAAVLPACGVDEVVDEVAAGAGVAGSAAPGAAAALSGCTVHAAGGGFGDLTLPAASTLAIVDLEATAAISPTLDAVISMASGPATSFNHLATSVRFSTAGVLDVRDGTTYRADKSIPFALGQPRKLRIVADIPSHTFSVYVEEATHLTTRLATRYAFRSTTATVPSLDRLAAIVDGAAGQLSVCNVVSATASAVAFTREGAYGVVPLASNQALVSDGSTVTMRLAANGAVLNQVAAGGELAADPAERAYVARVTGGQLSLRAYTATLAPRWSRLDPVPPGASVLAAAADSAGVTLALSTPGAGVSIRRYPETGAAGTAFFTVGTHAAVTPDGFAIATTAATAYTVAVFSNSGVLQWAKSFPGAIGASIEVMTLGLGGRVVLGGHYEAPITFGGLTLDPVHHQEIDLSTYVVGLDRASGAHVFSRQINASQLTGAAGNGPRLALSGERIVTPIFPDLWQLDASGAQIGGTPYVGFYEDYGRSGRIAIGPTNRVFWERTMLWPAPVSDPYPYLIAVQ